MPKTEDEPCDICGDPLGMDSGHHVDAYNAGGGKYLHHACRAASLADELSKARSDYEAARKDADVRQTISNDRQAFIERLEAKNEALAAEVGRLRDVLARVRAINWNWAGPANRNEAGDWVVPRFAEDKALDLIGSVLGPLNPPPATAAS